MKLTIIIPVYNEIKTIKKIIDKINLLKNIKKYIIIVDDGSTDGSKEFIKHKLKNKIYKSIFHKKNLGKGAAIKSAQKFVKGDIVIIQDADLEYYPKDYKRLLEPFKKKEINVVYGSRVLNKNRYLSKNFTSLLRVFFNHALTIFSNVMNNQNLTDAHTGYKVFRSKIFKKIKLMEQDFAFCPEITSKLSKLNENILEVPINYNGRSVAEGKKIRFKDGFRAIIVLFKYKFKSNF